MIQNLIARRVIWRNLGCVVALVLSVCNIGFVPQLARAETWVGSSRYVDGNSGTDNVGCTAIAFACRTIQYAIGQSAAGDRILVAGGTYTSTDLQVIYVPFTLTISGGWASDFNSQSGQTIVDAESVRRGVYIEPNVSVTFDHFTLRNGRSAGQGAGIYAGPNSPITLTHMTLENNVADNSGGGIYAEDDVAISDSHLENNKSNSSVGGGLYSNASATLQRTDFISNSAAYGGGAYAHDPSSIVGGRFERNSAAGGAGMLVSNTLQMHDAVFVGNLASGFGGGGIYIDGNATITNTRFIENKSVGGAGGGLYVRNVLTMTASQFNGNQSDFGGGAYTRVTAQLIGSSFITNTSTAGGGLFADQPVVMTNVDFISNTSSVKGGGGAYAKQGGWIAQSNFQANQSADSGGGLYAGKFITISNTTFDRNQALLGGGLFFDENALLAQVAFSNNRSQGGAGLYAIGAFTATTTNFSNNVATGNGGGFYAASHAALSKSVVQNNACTDSACLGGGAFLAAGADLAQTRLVGNVAPKGGGIFLLNGNVSIENSLLARNFATTLSGSALHLNSPGNIRIVHTTIASPTLAAGTAIYNSKGTLNISNTIVASQTLGVHVTGGTVLEDGNLFYGNTTNTIGTLLSGGHSRIGHPAFVDPNSDNYHLRPSSLAINRAVLSALAVDGDDDLRPQSDGPDIGQDETPYPTADDMAVSHQVTPLIALPGQAVTYTVRFTNLSQIATQVVLTDLIPAQIQVTSISSLLPITAIPGNAYVWSLPDLSLNEGGLIIIHGTVKNSVTQEMTVTHAAQVGSAHDNVPSNNSSNASLVVWMPVSGLTVNVGTGNAQVGSSTAFTASTTGGSNVSYGWDFGDGDAGAGANPQHIYNVAGTYHVVVTATNGLSVVTQTVPIIVQDVPISGLDVGSNLSGPIPAGSVVTYSATIDNGTGVSYVWTVDGVVVGTGPTLSYTFPSSGEHTVIVTATNSSGSQSFTVPVTVLYDSGILYLPAMFK